MPRLTRRSLIASAVPLAAPRLSRAAGAGTLRFIPQAAVTWFDPSFWPFLTTRNHAMMVYDTLYGTDSQGRVQPQMAAGHVVEDDGRTWRITLREGLVFHDGTKVLARDCVASIRRWGRHSAMGQSLLAASAEIAAADDRSIVFRLSQRFPMLAAALGGQAMQVCAMMPERVTQGADFRVISEVVGSGPFRFLVGEGVTGQVACYARHEAYVPRAEGMASFTAGPKVPHFERVEWHTMPDEEAALAALADGRMDWWEQPPAAAFGAIAANPSLALRVHDGAGLMGTMRMNHLTAPFSDPAVRRAVLRAIDQDAFMAAASGAGEAFRRTGVGFFCPASPMASDAGMATAALHPGLRMASGSNGVAELPASPVVVPLITDVPASRAIGEEGIRLLRRLGFAVEVVPVGLRELVPRLLRTEPPGAGGWNAVFGYWPGHDMWHPGMHRYLRAEGRGGEIGWPTSEHIEALRRAWLAAPDLASQQAIARDIQVQAFRDVPYVPLGQWLAPTAYSARLTGMLDGFPLFWSVRRG